MRMSCRQDFRLLATCLPMVRTRPFRLRIRLGHIRSRLSLAVEVRPIAVVHIARRIHPHHARTTPCRLRSRRSTRRRGSLRRLRGWSRCRSRCRTSLRNRRNHRSSRNRSCIPLLHPLVSAARALLIRSSRIRSILALSCRSCRRSRLCQRKLRAHQPQCNRHPTNCCLHTFSRKSIFLARIPPNATPSATGCHPELAHRRRQNAAQHPPNEVRAYPIRGMARLASFTLA
jgi:hypothetical protein